MNVALLWRKHMKHPIILLFLLCYTLPLLAVDSLELNVGYRTNSFKVTSIPSADPGMGLSSGETVQRKWNNFDAWYFGGEYEFVTCNNIYGKVEGDYGWIHDAHEHIITTIPSVSVVDLVGQGSKGQVYDIEIALGYMFSFRCDEFYVIPLIGASQNAFLLNNEIHLSDISSKYKVRWSSILIGFKAGWYMDYNWSLYCGYEYHPSAHFTNSFTEKNVVVDGIDTLRQSSHRGYGHDVYVGVNYIFCNNLYVGGKFDYKYYNSSSGHESEATLDGRYPYKNAQWYTYGGQLVLGYMF
jgi:hypothetical protein